MLLLRVSDSSHLRRNQPQIRNDSLLSEEDALMHRCWFRVYHQGQPLDPPVPEDDLPRRANLAGHIATLNDRGGALTAVYILAADGEQARELFEEARARLFTK